MNKRQIVGVVAVACSVAIASFQLALALGAPLGTIAWGGASPELSPTLRISSGIAVFVWMFIGYVYASKAGFLQSALSTQFVDTTTRITVWPLLVICFLNWISRSPMERNIWGPFITVLVISVWQLSKEDSASSVPYETVGDTIDV